MGETWRKIDASLYLGRRGLPGGNSLAKLLTEHYGIRGTGRLPDLPESQILTWADDYLRRHGRRPSRESGSIPESDGETWAIVSAALRFGLRGLPGGTTLAKFLAEHRGVKRWSKRHGTRSVD